MNIRINFRHIIEFAALVMWRTVREQRQALIIGPLWLIGLLIVAAGLSYYAPNFLTGFSSRALAIGATEVMGMPAGNRASLLAAFFSLQAPYFLLSFIGLTAARFTQGIVGGDIDGGAIELLLVSDLSIAEMALGNLVAICVATMTVALIVASGIITAIFLCAPVLDLSVVASHMGLVSLVVLTLSTCAFSVLIALVLCLLFPRLSGVYAGLSVSPLQLIASLPGVIALVAVTAQPSLVAYGMWLGAVFVVASVPLAALALTHFFDAALYVKS